MGESSDKDNASDPTARRTRGAGVALIVRHARAVIRTWFRWQADQDAAPSEGLFGGIRRPSQVMARKLVEKHPALFPKDLREARARNDARLVQWLREPPEALYPLAELAALFRLSQDDIALLIMAAAPGLDPELTDLYSLARDDLSQQGAKIASICGVLSLGDADRFDALLARCAFDAPLRRHRLLLVEARQRREDSLDLNLLERRVRVADRVLDFLRRDAAEVAEGVDEALAETCVRVHDLPEPDALSLPELSHHALLQIARARSLPALLEGPQGAGHEQVAGALARLLGRTLLSADLGALLNEPPRLLNLRLTELFREARLGGDLVYLDGLSLPERLPNPTAIALRRALAQESFVLGLESMPIWAVSITAGWPVVQILLPGYDERLAAWRGAFEGERRVPDDDALELIARRYQLALEQIQQAAAEARRRAQLSRRPRIDLSDLDRACRAHFAHQLSEVAQLVPPTPFKFDQLILPDREKEKFEEILLYAHEHDAIYSEWGFGRKFPYGRGLSVLFYGPPGTGKTMGAMIIANVLGLDLYRVDLSRIMSRYVGETEKNLARVFDEAERGRVMLLFDEADSLFTKRTEVKSSVDRYANLEVAYLLQRMENFEGVTVLTTNVEANLDDAFKRRIRYRIYFPMPDPPTRARLWRALIPDDAPLREGIPFKLLGRHYELSGGHIKQAVLRAGFYARRDRDSIGLRHLVEAAKAECREIGMLVTDDNPKALARALKAELEG